MQCEDDATSAPRPMTSAPSVGSGRDVHVPSAATIIKCGGPGQPGETRSVPSRSRIGVPLRSSTIRPSAGGPFYTLRCSCELAWSARVRTASFRYGYCPTLAYDSLPRARESHGAGNRLESTGDLRNHWPIAVVSATTKDVVARVRLYHPEPPSVVRGRWYLYDARSGSSNGEAACASCHVFGDLDSLVWDLGNPDATTAINPGPFAAIIAFGLPATTSRCSRAR